MSAWLGAVAAGTLVVASTQAAMADDKLETIIVTAQKRSENLQKVPIAVSATSATTMRARGIVSTADLTAVVPSLDLSQQLFFATPFLRGVGSPNSIVGEEPAVAVNVDGVYRPSLPGAIFNFNNVDHVEVLKGPQGTLFGRNAVGGVINVITKDPSYTPAVDVSIGYGNYDTLQASFYGTAGLTDKLAADLAVYYIDQGDGYLKNLVDGQRYGRERDISIRTKVKWDPSENTRVIVSLDYDDHETPTGVGLNSVAGGRLIDGTTGFGFYKINSDFPPRGLTRQYGASVNISHDFEWAKLVSISSYRHVKARLSLDQDATPIPLVHVTFDVPQTTYTQEVQLLSPSDSVIKWILGGYYFNDDAAYDPLFLTGLAFAPLPFLDKYGKETTESFAGFAQATVNLGFNTNLTLGYRYTNDRRSVTGYSFSTPAVFPPDGIQPGSFGSGTEKFGNGTYRASLDHSFSDNLMVYFSFNRGFKGGLFNTQAPQLPAVKPEFLNAFEIGEKAQFFDNRLQLNTAAFYYKFDQIQVQTIQAGVGFILNAAAAELKGFEVELEAVPIENLNLQAGLSYVDAKFTSFPNAPSNVPNPAPFGGNNAIVIDATGNTLPHAPKWTFNAGGQYSIPTDTGTFQLAATASYNAGFFWDPDNLVRQPSYTLVNSSVGWTSPNGRYDIRVWGRNLASAKYYAYATAQGLGDTGSPAPPLTYGFTIGLHL